MIMKIRHLVMMMDEVGVSEDVWLYTSGGIVVYASSIHFQAELRLLHYSFVDFRC